MLLDVGIGWRVSVSTSMPLDVEKFPLFRSRSHLVRYPANVLQAITLEGLSSTLCNDLTCSEFLLIRLLLCPAGLSPWMEDSHSQAGAVREEQTSESGFSLTSKWLTQGDDGDLESRSFLLFNVRNLWSRLNSSVSPERVRKSGQFGPVNSLNKLSMMSLKAQEARSRLTWDQRS